MSQLTSKSNENKIIKVDLSTENPSTSKPQKLCSECHDRPAQDIMTNVYGTLSTYCSAGCAYSSMHGV